MLNQVRQSLTVAPGSLSKRSALVRNTAPIALIDTEGVWRGIYHPDEYLGKVILQ